MLQKTTLQKNHTLFRILILALVVILTIGIFVFRDQVKQFATFGYSGIFLFTILAYGTVILPVPGVAIVIAMGGVLNPFWVGIAAGAGATIGELSSYAIGYSGQSLVENVKLYQRLHAWMEKSRWSTFAALFILSAIPNPAADIVGIAAGVLRVPLIQYLSARLLGEIIKMWFFAYAGAYSLVLVQFNSYRALS